MCLNRIMMGMSSWTIILTTVKSGGKCALTSHSCISVMDKVKINEQNKSIATGLLYVHTKFEAIWTLLPEDMAVLNPMGYRALYRRHCAYGTVNAKRDLKQLNKNESLMNRYNFSMVNATNFLFSPLHTTPLLYCKTYFGLLNYLLAIVAWSDIPRGSKPPYL